MTVCCIFQVNRGYYRSWRVFCEISRGSLLRQYTLSKPYVGRLLTLRRSVGLSRQLAGQWSVWSVSVYRFTLSRRSTCDRRHQMTSLWRQSRFPREIYQLPRHVTFFFRSLWHVTAFVLGRRRLFELSIHCS